ncbi:hypothetical protein SAMN05877753_102332 [Bacillus oleivorans]|uniref:YpfB family protein n=1 Tax=Bacillus oleivorans TaxID=1448271 RepID=A0A285CM83_9BACI|nr:YpfB family protein [Bacillus oleivorans]SNX68123.1 hypothetical protein SAMN05877753_102332 [Bacillus oleivorans]
MKRGEGILIKLIIIQAIALLFFQIIFHYSDAFPELKRLTMYEGVSKDNFTKVIETFKLP